MFASTICVINVLVESNVTLYIVWQMKKKSQFASISKRMDHATKGKIVVIATHLIYKVVLAVKTRSKKCVLTTSVAFAKWGLAVSTSTTTTSPTKRESVKITCWVSVPKVQSA